MRRILVALLGLLMVAALAGAGTFAYFSDDEVSSANTFTAGTLNLALSNDGSAYTDGVTGTWVSPSNWAPGESFEASIKCTNTGSVDARHIYFTFSNLQNNGNGDGSNLFNAIIVTKVQSKFNGHLGINRAPYLAATLGNHDGVLTLAEYLGSSYYTFDYVSGDGIVLAKNDQKDYELILGFLFNANAGNEYQGDSCRFDMTLNATQNSPTEGYIAIDEE